MPSYQKYSKSSFRPRSLRKLEKKSKQHIIITTLIGFSLIYILFAWGLPSLIGALSVFNKLKHSTNTPSLGIEDSAITPPVLNIPFDSTNSATIRISGYSYSGSKVEIYVDDDLKSTSNTNADGTFTSEDISLGLGTNSISAKTVNEKGNKSLSSKSIRINYSNDKPKLEISNPNDNQQFKGGDKKIKVSGKTDPTSSISINGATTIVSGDGTFSSDFSLNDGDNLIKIVATNSVGNITEISKTVNYAQ